MTGRGGRAFLFCVSAEEEAIISSLTISDRVVDVFPIVSPSNDINY